MKRCPGPFDRGCDALIDESRELCGFCHQRTRPQKMRDGARSRAAMATADPSEAQPVHAERASSGGPHLTNKTTDQGGRRNANS